MALKKEITKRIGVTIHQVKFAIQLARASPKTSSGRLRDLSKAQTDRLEKFFRSFLET